GSAGAGAGAPGAGDPADEPAPVPTTAAVRLAVVGSARPVPAPRAVSSVASAAAPAAQAKAPRTPGSTFAAAEPASGRPALLASSKPVPKSDTVILAALEEEGDRSEPEATEIVSRPVTKGRGNYGITLGRYKTKAEAEQLLLRIALQESAVLSNAVRRVGDTPRGWEANFSGLTRDAAQLACDKLAATAQRCTVLGN
ncbi:MAG TPA: D-alanyl-D-alanine carboxypeptidase, partial [Paracoccus solventivorans]|nr:D-alanyl-D-alanine carboxypeptidase [Paracoccus solventivorans]